MVAARVLSERSTEHTYLPMLWVRLAGFQKLQEVPGVPNTGGGVRFRSGPPHRGHGVQRGVGQSSGYIPGTTNAGNLGVWGHFRIPCFILSILNAHKSRGTTNAGKSGENSVPRSTGAWNIFRSVAPLLITVVFGLGWGVLPNI